MTRRWMTHSLAVAGLLLGSWQCSMDMARSEATLALVGARLIDGLGGPPIEDSVLLLREGRIHALGERGAIEIPADSKVVNLEGRTIIPGLINSHAHVGSLDGLRYGPRRYSRRNVVNQLELYARYGVTTVQSMGGGRKASLELRDRQETPSLTRTRLFVAGPVMSPPTLEDALSFLDRLVPTRPDFVKIRVDDKMGFELKMPPGIYEEVIRESHRQALRVAAHVFYLEDAKGLLRAGVDILAHNVRDQEVDQELIDLLKEKDVCVIPTLAGDLSAFVYAQEAAILEDPFLLAAADEEVVSELSSPRMRRIFRDDPIAPLFEEVLERSMLNLKRLAHGGVRIAFGSDSGIVGTFPGYFEHLELQLMAEAGLEPMEILVSATSGAASCLGLDESLGSLGAGKWADFIVLLEDPLKDIRNTRTIESVWIAGNPIENPVSAPPAASARRASSAQE